MGKTHLSPLRSFKQFYIWLNMVFLKPVVRPLTNIITFYKQKVLATTLFTFDILLKVCVVFLILATFFTASLFIYIAFYNAHVPSSVHQYPVHLQYKSCAQKASGDNDCPYPTAHIQLTKDSQFLMVGQPYKISITFEMPESPANKEIGMFMICGQLMGKSGRLVNFVCRSSSLRYRGLFVHLLTVITFAPFYVFGSLEEKQVRTVELFNHFQDDQTLPVTDMFIEFKSHKVEVYSSTLQISAHMSGLRYFMYYWRTTAAVTGVALIFAFITFVASLSLWQLYGPHNESGRVYIYDGIGRLSPFKFRGDKDKEKKQPVGRDTIEEVSSEAKNVDPEGESEFLTEVMKLDTSSDA